MDHTASKPGFVSTLTACPSAQSDRSLKSAIAIKDATCEILSSLCSWAVWYEHDLVVNAEDRSRGYKKSFWAPNFHGSEKLKYQHMNKCFALSLSDVVFIMLIIVKRHISIYGNKSDRVSPSPPSSIPPPPITTTSTTAAAPPQPPPPPPTTTTTTTRTTTTTTENLHKQQHDTKTNISICKPLCTRWVFYYFNNTGAVCSKAVLLLGRCCC